MDIDIPLIRLPNSTNQQYHIDGNLGKKLLILCSEADLSNGGKEKLLEIIKAIGFNYPDDLGILYGSMNFDLNYLMEQYPFDKLFAFGWTPKELGIQSTLLHYKRYSFECFQFVLSESIQSIKENADKKRALWQAIQSFKL